MTELVEEVEEDEVDGSRSAELLEVLLERSVGRLGSGEVAGLQRLTELGEELRERILRGRILRGRGMMMVMMVAGDGARGLLLKVLLYSGVVLLSGGKIAGLEVLRELTHGGGKGAG